VTGIRPGEKIHEVLVSEHEMPRSTELDDYFIIPPELHGVMNTNDRPPGCEYTSANTQRLESKEQVIELLEKMGKVEFYT
jgi:FlaA1/EpsC-like NDP-sugar epimerase